MADKIRKKNESCVCPQCNSGEYVERYDTEFDVDLMINKMYCTKCNNSWREYYILQYDGYSDESGEYDANGNDINDEADMM